MPRRGRKANWSAHKRTRIRILYESGVPTREIAIREGVPAGSVHGIATRYEGQVSGQDQPRPGRPKKNRDAEDAEPSNAPGDQQSATRTAPVQRRLAPHEAPQPSAYSKEQISNWIRRVDPPHSILQHMEDPDHIPKTAVALRTLMRCQITTFPYENLSVHYSPTHLVNIHPQVLYDKLMGPENGGRGGYCMELSIFFYHVLRAIGFDVYMTGVRNRTRTNGVPGGTYQGWTHINNIVHLPSGERYSVDVAFGGDGPTSPLPMNEAATALRNLGTQEVRLVHDLMPKQHLRHRAGSRDDRVWIYEYRNGTDRDWNAFYSFAEIEFFQEDFEVMNWWGSAKTLHRWTVLAVRFLRRDEPLLYDERAGWRSEGDEGGVEVAGKVMLINDTIKVNLGGGRSTVLETFNTEGGRLKALRDYFGIQLNKEQEESIRGWDMALA